MGRPVLPDSPTYSVDAVLAFIVAFKRANDGCSPTIREIQEGCQVSSTSVVNFLLEKLEAKGKIVRWGEGSSRGIRVVGGVWNLTPDPFPEGKGKKGGGKGRPRKERVGRVLFDPYGDFTGKEFSLTELRGMLNARALAVGSVYEMDGQRYEVGEG